MGRRIIAIVVATVVALVGVAAVLLYAKGAEARAVAAQQPVEVYVAQAKVTSGTTLKDAVRTGLVTKTTVAAKGAPAGALKQVTDSNAALLAVTDIQAGEFVLESRFGTTPAGTKAIEVPSGQVAVSVSLSDPARVGTFVTPGSRVVLFTTYEPPAASSSGSGGSAPAASTTTRVLLDDVLVIAMGEASLTPVPAANGEEAAAPAASSGTAALVTVAVTPADAAKLVHGIQTGRLYAALRGSDAKVDLGVAVTNATVAGTK